MTKSRTLYLTTKVIEPVEERPGETFRTDSILVIPDREGGHNILTSGSIVNDEGAIMGFLDHPTRGEVKAIIAKAGGVERCESR